MQHVINTSGKYIMVKELAQLLRITNASIIAAINRGELPAIRIGASYRIDISQPLSDDVGKDEPKATVESDEQEKAVQA